MSDVHVVRLSGKASRFLQLLQDFGHLDDDSAAQVMLGVGDPMGRGRRSVDLPEVRRAAAAMLFSRGEGDLDALLAEDWPLLFS